MNIYKTLTANTIETPQPRSGQQHQIAIQDPLIRPTGTFSPCLGRREKGRSYLEETPQPRSGQQHQIATQDPLIRPTGTFSPCLGRKENEGFSLIELLVVLVIIGILMAIAYPSYLNYILKSHRSDALATLTQDQISLERCYSQNFSYNAACGALPAFPQASPQGFYSIAISNLGPTTYTLTATPVGPQTQDTTCMTFTVNQANVKTGTDNSGAAQPTCWNPT